MVSDQSGLTARVGNRLLSDRLAEDRCVLGVQSSVPGLCRSALQE